MEKNWCKISVKNDIFFEDGTEEEGRSKAEN